MDGAKTYRFTRRFGEARATDDAEGPVTETSATRPGDDEIRAVLPGFTGPIQQVPPAFSAIKVDGVRAYALARAAAAVALAPRPVRIDPPHLHPLADAHTPQPLVRSITGQNRHRVGQEGDC